MSNHLRRQTVENPQTQWLPHAWRFAILSLALGTVGCTTPQFAWNNPFQRSAGSEATSATTIAARIAKVQSAGEDIEYISEAEQMRLSTQLVQDFAKESHPIVRQEIAKALGRFRTPSALEGLRLAVRDGDRDVRIAACESLAGWGTPETFNLLAEVLHSDTDVDVRLTATRLLGDSQEASTIGALGRALDDPDPAVQYLAVQSLQRNTGQKAGNDLKEWKRIARQLSSSSGPSEGAAEGASVRR
jgi:hypothetical protein